LQRLWRRSEPGCGVLPCLRNIKTGFIAASIHYQTNCPGPPLARAIAPCLSALVSAAVIKRIARYMRRQLRQTEDCLDYAHLQILRRYRAARRAALSFLWGVTSNLRAASLHFEPECFCICHSSCGSARHIMVLVTTLTQSAAPSSFVSSFGR
jgi:hypothetical protein